MVLILASTNLLTARIAAGCFLAALLVVLFVAKNVSTYEHVDFLFLFNIPYECCTALMKEFGFHMKNTAFQMVVECKI